MQTKYLKQVLAKYSTNHDLCFDLGDNAGAKFWDGAAYAINVLIRTEEQTNNQGESHGNDHERTKATAQSAA